MTTSDLDRKLVAELELRACSRQTIREVFPLANGTWKGFATFLRQEEPKLWETVEAVGCPDARTAYLRLLAGIQAVPAPGGGK